MPALAEYDHVRNARRDTLRHDFRPRRRCVSTRCANRRRWTRINYDLRAPGVTWAGVRERRRGAEAQSSWRRTWSSRTQWRRPWLSMKRTYSTP